MAGAGEEQTTQAESWFDAGRAAATIDAIEAMQGVPRGLAQNYLLIAVRELRRIAGPDAEPGEGWTAASVNQPPQDKLREAEIGTNKLGHTDMLFIYGDPDAEAVLYADTTHFEDGSVQKAHVTAFIIDRNAGTIDQATLYAKTETRGPLQFHRFGVEELAMKPADWDRLTREELERRVYSQRLAAVALGATPTEYAATNGTLDEDAQADTVNSLDHILREGAQDSQGIERFREQVGRPHGRGARVKYLDRALWTEPS